MVQIDTLIAYYKVDFKGRDKCVKSLRELTKRKKYFRPPTKNSLKYYSQPNPKLTRFSKILDYCYYCGNKVYIPSVHRVVVCSVHFGRDLRSFRARTPRSVALYKLYRSFGLLPSHRKVIPTKSSPGATILPQRHKIKIFIKPNTEIRHHTSPLRRTRSSFGP